jgi:glycosyltransferase
MKVSIITVVFNNQVSISDAIDSVQKQTYVNLEYIIIDGNSTDNTLDIITTKMASNIKLISEPDLGLYDAMNKGIKNSTGEIIGILNSDDLYQDNIVIEDVINVFKNDESIQIVYGDLVYVKSDSINTVVRRWNSKPYYNNFFNNGNVPPHPTMFIKRKIYEEIGMFNLKYKLAADYDFMLRLFIKGEYKSYYYNRLMVRMRLGGATNKSLRNIFSGNNEIIQSWRDNGLKFPIRLIPFKLFKRIIQFL